MPVKSDFRLWLLLTFALLFLSLCACIAENADVDIKKDAVDDVVNEEKNPLEKREVILPVSEGRLDNTHHVVKLDQQVTVPIEWLGNAWKDFERSENCQADNKNLPQVNFSDSSICELHNFELFLIDSLKKLTFRYPQQNFH